MEIQEGRDFQIQDYGDKVDLTSNLFYGILGGVEYLLDKGYEINYNGLQVIGSGTYLVPAVKSSKTKTPEYINQLNMLREEIEVKDKEIDELQKENTSLNHQVRTSKSHITKLKNKINKLEEK